MKEQKVDRSTVFRFQLMGGKDKYAFKRSEVVSQYVYKFVEAETGNHGSAMHTIVSSELVFRGVKKEGRAGPMPSQSSEKDESLLFSNQWDVDEKRFYMYGDEEFLRNSPFKDVKNKVSLAEQAFSKLARIVQKSHQNGIEVKFLPAFILLPNNSV